MQQMVMICILQYIFQYSSSSFVLRQFFCFTFTPTICLYKDLPRLHNYNVFVYLINILWIFFFVLVAILSKTCSLCFLLSLQFKSTGNSLPSSSHKGCVILSTHFLRPLSFQIPSSLKCNMT